MKENSTISIIELHYHAEVITVLLELLEESSFNTQLFTTDTIAGQVGKIPTEVEVFSTPNITNEWLSDIKNELTESDCILVNTLAGHYEFIRSLPPKIPKILRIHNVNTFFKQDISFHPKLTLFQVWKDFSYIVRKLIFYNELSQIRKTLPYFDFFIFPSSPMASRAMELSSLDTTKFIKQPFPLTYSESVEKRQTSEKFSIVISGGVDPRKKNLDPLIEALDKLDTKQTIDLEEIKISFLGRVRSRAGMSMIRKFDSLRERGLEVEYFEEFIPFEIFDEKFQSADVVLAPILKTTRFHIYEEEYGFTKVTGAMNDAIRFSKPIILPDFYPRSKETAKMTYHYKSASELSALLIDLYKKKSENKLSIPPIFTKKHLSEKLNEFLSLVIERNK